jgi:hypothetical protein
MIQAEPLISPGENAPMTAKTLKKYIWPRVGIMPGGGAIWIFEPDEVV